MAHPTDHALVASDQARAGLDPTGFDPSREWLEIRPDDDGNFDEIVARFADGMVHVEMMTDKSCYIGFYHDDGRLCQWWISSGKKLRSHTEQGKSDPPRYTAQGVDTKPHLPDYGAIGTTPTQATRTTGLAEEVMEPVAGIEPALSSYKSDVLPLN